MFTDPKGIKWIGIPAWRTHVVKRTLDDMGREKGGQSSHHERSSDEEQGEIQHPDALTSPAPTPLTNQVPTPIAEDPVSKEVAA